MSDYIWFIPVLDHVRCQCRGSGIVGDGLSTGANTCTKLTCDEYECAEDRCRNFQIWPIYYFKCSFQQRQSTLTVTTLNETYTKIQFVFVKIWIFKLFLFQKQQPAIFLFVATLCWWRESRLVMIATVLKCRWPKDHIGDFSLFLWFLDIINRSPASM